MSKVFPKLNADKGNRLEKQARGFTPLLLLVSVLLALFGSEIMLLSVLEYRFPTNLSSPAADFWSFAHMVWSQAPWVTTQEWLDRPLLTVQAIDQASAQTAWTLDYYVSTVLTHLLVATLTVMYWYRRSLQRIRPREWADLTGAGLTLLASTFYLSISAHCAGSAWFGIVIIRSIEKNAIQLSFMMQRLALDMPTAILFLQLAIGIAGLVWYYRLFRPAPLSSTFSS